MYVLFLFIYKGINWHPWQKMFKLLLNTTQLLTIIVKALVNKTFCIFFGMFNYFEQKSRIILSVQGVFYCDLIHERDYYHINELFHLRSPQYDKQSWPKRDWRLKVSDMASLARLFIRLKILYRISYFEYVGAISIGSTNPAHSRPQTTTVDLELWNIIFLLFKLV